MTKTLFIQKMPCTSKKKKMNIVWFHGWGLSYQSLLPLAGYFTDIADQFLFDLPGFGQSAVPLEVWGSADYAKALLEHLPKNKLPTVLVGHSFGGRIALHLAAEGKANKVVLLGASGLQEKRSFYFKVKAFIIKYLARLMRVFGIQPNLGSADYRAAKGIMRPIFVKVIRENLLDVAAKVKVPALLIYGKKDTEAPPSFGKRYAAVMKKSKLHILEGQDHWSILSNGRGKTLDLMERFLEL